MFVWLSRSNTRSDTIRLDASFHSTGATARRKSEGTRESAVCRGPDRELVFQNRFPQLWTHGLKNRVHAPSREYELLLFQFRCTWRLSLRLRRLPEGFFYFLRVAPELRHKLPGRCSSWCVALSPKVRVLAAREITAANPFDSGRRGESRGQYLLSGCYRQCRTWDVEVEPQHACDLLRIGDIPSSRTHQSKPISPFSPIPNEQLTFHRCALQPLIALASPQAAQAKI
jgi:hypothetical protein